MGFLFKTGEVLTSLKGSARDTIPILFKSLTTWSAVAATVYEGNGRNLRVAKAIPLSTGRKVLPGAQRRETVY